MSTNTPPRDDDHDDEPHEPVSEDAAAGITWYTLQPLFQVILDAIRRWDEDDYCEYEEHRAARQHLRDLAKALVIVSELQVREDDAWRAAFAARQAATTTHTT